MAKAGVFRLMVWRASCGEGGEVRDDLIEQHGGERILFVKFGIPARVRARPEEGRWRGSHGEG